MLSATNSSRRQRMGHSAYYPSDVWETDAATVPAVRVKEVVAPRLGSQRVGGRESAMRNSTARVQAAASKVSSPVIAKDKKLADRKMGGLSLPDVVRELLKERNILRWDSSEGVYEVLHGENFETRFNELRKVRNKSKSSGIERPFSRMYNFFVLETGDKWARTGTKFRPRNAKGMPLSETMGRSPTREVRRAPNNESSRSDRNIIAQTEASDSVSETKQISTTIAIVDERVANVPAKHPSARVSKCHKKNARKSSRLTKKSKSVQPEILDQEEAAYATFVREASPCGEAFFAAPVEYAGQIHPNGPDPAIMPADEDSGYTYPVHVGEAFETMKADDMLGCETSKCGSGLGRFFKGPEVCVGDEDTHSVHDISSPDASCHASPEGVLSLCGEFGGSPLDIGAPAIDAVAAATAAAMLGDCDMPCLDAGVVAGFHAPPAAPGVSTLCSVFEEPLDTEAQWTSQPGLCW